MSEPLQMYVLSPASLNAYYNQLQADAAAHPGTAEAEYDEDAMQALRLEQDMEKNPQNAKADEKAMQALYLEEYALFEQDPSCASHAAFSGGGWVPLPG